MTTKPIIITLNPRDSVCVCGVRCSHEYGIAMYEDMVLPNDWRGEWFGRNACRDCYEKQQYIRSPVSARAFAAMSMYDVMRTPQRDIIPDTTSAEL